MRNLASETAAGGQHLLSKTHQFDDILRRQNVVQPLAQRSLQLHVRMRIVHPGVAQLPVDMGDAYRRVRQRDAKAFLALSKGGGRVFALAQMIANLVLPASRPERDADRADQRLPHHWPFEQREAARRAERFQDTRDRRFATSADEQDQREIRPGRLLPQISRQQIEGGRTQSFLGDYRCTGATCDALAKLTDRSTNPGK